MLCYFISRKNFKIIDVVPANSYSAELDLDCGGKSSIVIAGDPGASDEDFILLKDGKEIKLKGIIEKIDYADDEIKRDISILEMEQIFDRKILLSDTGIISQTGIEDFIVKTIQTYFSDTGDDFIDMSYIECKALTHTKINAKPSADDGVYNFKTYIGNIKQQYGIFIDFEFDKEKLIISIYKNSHLPMNIDTHDSDITSVSESYKIKGLAKLSVLWHNLTTNTEEIRHFYLHTNRTVSEENKDRVDGIVSSIRLETDTEEEMRQEVANEFKGNSYSHSIEAEIYANSKIYPKEELYVGHEITIRTAAGVKDSIISGISYSDESNTILVKCGILKVTLTDKLK